MTDQITLTGYFDIAGLSVHQLAEHLTDEQQDSYRAQITAMLLDSHFEVDALKMELAVVADDVIVFEEATGPLVSPTGPRLRPKTLRRHRLQYTVKVRAMPQPASSKLIMPGRDGLQARTLRPLPPSGDTP